MYYAVQQSEPFIRWSLSFYSLVLMTVYKRFLKLVSAIKEQKKNQKSDANNPQKKENS